MIGLLINIILECKKKYILYNIKNKYVLIQLFILININIYTCIYYTYLYIYL